MYGATVEKKKERDYCFVKDNRETSLIGGLE